MKISRFAAAFLVGTLALYDSGTSQQAPPGPYRVFAYLRDASAQLRSDGFEEYQPPEGGVLRSGQIATMRLALQPGREYQVLGLCDEHCGNLDMALLDPAGTLLDSDQAEDNLPFIHARPAQAGTYHLRVTMRECSAEACFFAIAVVVK